MEPIKYDSDYKFQQYLIIGVIISIKLLNISFGVSNINKLFNFSIILLIFILIARLIAQSANYIYAHDNYLTVRNYIFYSTLIPYQNLKDVLVKSNYFEIVYTKNYQIKYCRVYKERISQKDMNSLIAFLDQKMDENDAQIAIAKAQKEK